MWLNAIEIVCFLSHFPPAAFLFYYLVIPYDLFFNIYFFRKLTTIFGEPVEIWLRHHPINDLMTIVAKSK